MGMSATYELGTDIGKVRLEIPDTDVSKAVFSDKEILYFLSQNKGNIQGAAAHALSIILGDPHRCVQWSRGSVSSMKSTQEAIKSRIQELRADYDGGFASIPVTRGDWYE